MRCSPATCSVSRRRDELDRFIPDFTVLQLPSLEADPATDGTRSSVAIVLDFAARTVLICGTRYAGEIKKSIFTVLNHLLPAEGVFPMHCSANAGASGDVAIFFGLSGTGKTTLSADPTRTLIGDDEHGWSARGVFNFEGGCYAKVIRLSPEDEPEIYAASTRFGAILENVAVDPLTGAIDFDDDSLTENTRSSYPLHFIPNASASGQGGHPAHIVMLTADAFGVLPPISRLSPEQAMYHFLSGYTARVAGTEQGVKEPQATFSTCFGAPFMPRRPTVYAEMLRDFMRRHEVACWLVNTGWSGGPYGTGERISLRHTRAMLRAALGGALTTCAVPAASGVRPDDPGKPVPRCRARCSIRGRPGAIRRPTTAWRARSPSASRTTSRALPRTSATTSKPPAFTRPYRRPSDDRDGSVGRHRAPVMHPAKTVDVKEAWPLAVNWLAKPPMQTDTARWWRHRSGAQCSRRLPLLASSVSSRPSSAPT